MKNTDENKLDDFRNYINLKRLTEGVSKDLFKSENPTKSGREDLTGLSIQDVGRLGEESFLNYLDSVLDKDYCTITWVNQFDEKGLPYDFLIKLGDLEYKVDVKTTRGNHSNDIFFSKKEYSFALKNESQYFVARLFENSTDKGKLRAGVFNVKVQTLSEILHLIKIKES